MNRLSQTKNIWPTAAPKNNCEDDVPLLPSAPKTKNYISIVSLECIQDVGNKEPENEIDLNSRNIQFV